MKLVKRDQAGWHYRLPQREAELLRWLVGQFPATSRPPVVVSQTDRGRKSVEREQLLNEALVDHRAELKRVAKLLVEQKRFTVSANDQIYLLTGEDRELLLQILNDLRMGCWREMGEPTTTELNEEELPKEKLRFYHAMHLAGYFLFHLVEEEVVGDA